MKTSILGVFALLIHGTSWAAGMEYCDGPTIGVLNDYDYPVRYQWIGNRDPHAFTVVYLEGGPGPGSTVDPETGLASFRKSLGVDDSVNLLMVDPRGANCNEGWALALPDDEFSTEAVARDTAAVIRSLGLSRYVLFGHSYGTQLATVLAFQLERDTRVVPPSLVILNGVVGRAERTMEEASTSINQAWSRAKFEFPSAALARIDSLVHEGKARGEAANIAGFLDDVLRIGRQYIDGVMSAPELEAMKRYGSMPDSDFGAFFSSVLYRNGLPVGGGVFGYRFGSLVRCREMSEYHGFSVLNAGRFVYWPEAGSCADTPLDRPYDPAAYPLRTRVFMYNGGYDPATSLEEAQYYYDVQKSNAVDFVSYPQGGHLPMAFVYRDCMKGFWGAVIQGKSALADSFRRCVAPAVIQSKRSNYQ